MKTQIARWGNSLAIRLSKQVAEDSGLTEGSDVEVRAHKGKITIVPRIPQYDIDELVRQMKGKKAPKLEDWGPAVGEEIDL